MGEEYSDLSGDVYRADAQVSNAYVSVQRPPALASSPSLRSPAYSNSSPLFGEGRGGEVSAGESPLAGSALARSTLPAVQGLLKSLSAAKMKKVPSYRRKEDIEKHQEQLMLPVVRTATPGAGARRSNSDREFAAAAATTAASPSVGLSGFMFDPIFSTRNTFDVGASEPLPTSPSQATRAGPRLPNPAHSAPSPQRRDAPVLNSPSPRQAQLGATEKPRAASRSKRK